MFFCLVLECDNEKKIEKKSEKKNYSSPRIKKSYEKYRKRKCIKNMLSTGILEYLMADKEILLNTAKTL